MRKWTTRVLTGCGGTILACIGCGLLLYVFQERPPERSFAIEVLLIDASVFPAGWEADPEGPQPVYTRAAPLGSGAVPAIESRVLLFARSVRGGSGSAGHSVYRLSSRQRAAEEFQVRRERWFPVGPYDTPWETPPELSDLDLAADQFYVACSRQGSIPMCGLLAQYEEYLVSFDTHMEAYDSRLQLVPIMTYTEFRRIVKAIDQRMAYYLKPSLAPTP